MLATFSGTAPSLMLDLAANEAVSIVAATTTANNTTTSIYTLKLDSPGTWIGTNDGNVSGNGTDTLTVQESAFTQVDITDSGAGTSVTFNDSGSNTYDSNFNVTLDDLAAGSIAFKGATRFTGSNALSASTTASVQVGDGSATTASVSTAAGTLTLEGAGITFANGVVSATSGDVTLTGAGGSITETTPNAGADVSGATVTLKTTGFGNQIGTPGPVGGSSTPLKVDASTLLNASTSGGFITLANTTGNMPLGVLDAGAAFIELTAVGAITDGKNGSGSPNLTGVDGAALTTTGPNSAIGTSTHPIRTAIGALTATTYDGGVFIADSNVPALMINSVLAKEGGQAPFLDINNQNQVLIFDPDGQSNPHAGTDNVSITATGDILLAGTANVSTIVAAPNAVTISSSGGRILQGQPGLDSVLARSLKLMADSSIGVAGGAIGLTVESVSASTTSGGIFLAELIPGTVTSVVAGGAGNDVSVVGSGATLDVGTITAPGTVTLQETGGALLSGASTKVTGQTVKLTGKSGIGSSASAPFVVTADSLEATASNSGAAIFVKDTTALSSLSATTNAGNATIDYSGGSLLFTASTGKLTASGAATVSFDNTGGDVVLGAVHVASITASGAITADSSVDVTGGTVTLTAGTGIGAAASPIQTDVTALNATTTSGNIFISQASAFTLNASSLGYSDPLGMTGSDINASTATGAMTVGIVSALGTVTLNAGGALLAGSLAGASSASNVSADTLSLTAANGIGTSGAVVMTSVNTLTASGGAGGGLFVSNNKTLSLPSASATGGAVSITALGDLDVGSVTAAGQAVTLSATGALIDTNGPALNVTAQTATLSGSSIGSSSDALETRVASITATTASGGIYISDLGTGSLTLTATALGAGAGINFTSAGSIDLMTVTAQGDTVTLNAAGSITNGLTTPGVNITAQTLSIVAPGGIGTSANPLEILVAQITSTDGGTPGVFMINAGPLEITKAALQATGSGTLTFDAASLVIDDMGGSAVSLAFDRSLVLRTKTGPIVFLNPADTIQVSGAGTITVAAGTTPGSGGVAVLGNLTTAGGNILVTADSSITIGQFNAGSGDVTVQSAQGIIMDGNGPSTVNVIAGSTTLSGNAPTARQLELNEEMAIAAAAAAVALASADQTTAEAITAQLTDIIATVKLDETAAAAAEAAATAADNAYKVATDTLNGMNVALAALQVVDLAVDLGVDVALAVTASDVTPVFGDGGSQAIYATLKIVEDSIRLAMGAAQVAVNSYAFTVTDLGNKDVSADATAIAAESTLALAKATQDALSESKSIALAAAGNALLQSETAGVVSNQAIAARDQANVIGSLSDPLGIQVTGVINVTAGPTDSYLQVVGDTALHQINATGSITLISTGTITNGAPANTPNILATGLTITAVNGIGTAANPLLTRVGTLNATNTGSGDIVISNTAGTPAALEITGVSNLSGGNVVIANEGNAAAGAGNHRDGPDQHGRGRDRDDQLRKPLDDRRERDVGQRPHPLGGGHGRHWR